ncbi:hypothetical protein BC834DRAFT_499363 [Gloeopeniophorella convolvens]|nr:hypothetical protein BC834DRAFT_499363 [Gloeopeniophorella convolvens]
MSPTHARTPLDLTAAAERRRSWGVEAGGGTLEEVLALDGHQDSQSDGQQPGVPRYPGSDDSERITWAKWDVLHPMGSDSAKRILILGYLSGLQLWDCSNLDSITELVNLSGPEWGRVWHAEVLPNPLVADNDQFRRSRPLLGIISKRQKQGPEFLVYSLATHNVVKKLSISGIVSFSANSNVIIISSANPNSLRILSACTFASLSIISSGLSTFTHPQSISTTPTNLDTTVLPSNDLDPDAVPSVPLPIYALSLRFLAYVSRVPTATPLDTQTQAQTPVRAEGAGAQADFGGIALRVGGSVLSGMRALGGRALTAARARITDTSPAPSPKPLSRSAPEQETLPTESDVRSAQAGYRVTVLDLAPLMASSPRVPELLVEFLASKRQPIAALRFSADGGALMVIPGDGQITKVFQLRPVPRALRLAVDEAAQRGEVEGAPMVPESAPWHMYDLRRGRTSAIVESHDWAPDGRWIAIATKRRTVHVFATNPYGGKPNGDSHTKSRVYNSPGLALSTSLSPLVRLRTSQPSAGLPAAPLAFTFIRSDAHSLPKRLLPPPSIVSPPSSAPNSVHSSPSQEPLTPPQRRRPTNFQDFLLFDPADGSLSLRRCVINFRAHEHNLSVPSAVPGIGGTSISLPSRPSFARVSASPPAPAISSRTRSSGAQAADKPVDMVAHEGEVATWNLRRGRGWPVLKRPVQRDAHAPQARGPASKQNWLSYAELRTSSQSPLVLPRPLYISHQFSFHALSHDYHGQLRRFQFDVLGPKIEVRKEVEVSAYAAGAGEAFVYGSHDAGRVSSSFDEPLSSAMASGLEYPASPPVIPMFPNGTPGSFKNSIPIQRVADGMSEGLARVRREIGKVRSPRLADPRAAVPLEFDEEDEDFILNYGDADAGTSPSRDDGGSISISTPSSGPGDGPERTGWDTGDAKADDVAEPFQEISVVGFMDEEQVQERRSRSLVR